jgi:hypothetical protein
MTKYEILPLANTLMTSGVTPSHNDFPHLGREVRFLRGSATARSRARWSARCARSTAERYSAHWGDPRTFQMVMLTAFHAGEGWKGAPSRGSMRRAGGRDRGRNSGGAGENYQHRSRRPHYRARALRLPRAGSIRHVAAGQRMRLPRRLQSSTRWCYVALFPASTFFSSAQRCTSIGFR